MPLFTIPAACLVGERAEHYVAVDEAFLLARSWPGLDGRTEDSGRCRRGSVRRDDAGEEL